MIIYPGKLIAFFLLLISYVMVYLGIRASLSGKVPKIRAIPAVDALSEGIGRAAEMGRPVHFTTGWGGGGLYTEQAPWHMAGINLLNIVALETAQKGAGLIVTLCHPEMVPIAEETVRQAYIRAGKPESFDPSMIRYIAPAQMSYAIGVVGTMQREKPAASYILGMVWAETLILAEGGNLVGAFQVAGTGEWTALPFLITTCDYVLLCEELFAAGAVISKDAASLGGLAGEDIPKLLVIVMTIIGVILASLNIDWSWLLGL
jgi:hypothetical protein